LDEQKSPKRLAGLAGCRIWHIGHSKVGTIQGLARHQVVLEPPQATLEGGKSAKSQGTMWLDNQP